MEAPSTSTEPILLEFRSRLQRNRDLMLELASKPRTSETCLAGGLNTFRDAIQNGSICTDLAMAKPFLERAFQHLSHAATGLPHYREIAREQATAGQRCEAYFGLFVSRDLSSGHRFPTELSILEQAVEEISVVLTEQEIGKVGIEAPGYAVEVADHPSRRSRIASGGLLTTSLAACCKS